MITLEEIVKSFMMDFKWPLFADILIKCERRLTDSKSMDTACISLGEQAPVITVNRAYLAKITNGEHGKTHAKGVIAHELQHYIFDHRQRFMPIYEQIKKGELTKAHANLVNIAMDIAINQLNPYLLSIPREVADCMWHDSFKSHGIELEPLQSAEYYYNELKKAVDKMPPMECNDHSSLFEGPVDPLTKFRFDDMMQKAISNQKERDKTCGIGGGDSILKTLPEKTKTDSKIWKTLVNRAFGDDLDEVDYRYGRPSRQNRNSYHGTVRTKVKPFVYCILDTSASTSDAHQAAWCGHINAALKKHCGAVTVIYCDGEIQKIEDLESSKKMFDVVGRGGTDLTKAIDWIHEKEPSRPVNVVVLTDGCTPWHSYPNMIVTAIYTEQHSPLPNVKYSAVLAI